ncbi:MAG: response regulator [Gammaproteobacteria bacterium]|nr:response regulator [Gammaproteobacteria bacterium]
MTSLKLVTNGNPHQGAHLFVVDDNATLLIALEHGLSKRGYKVSTFENGEDAVAAYREHTPDLVILDCKMPGMSGPEVAQLMIEHVHRPIIMLSGLDDDDMVHGMIAKGISAYLVKPMSTSQVAAVVESSLSRFSEVSALMRDSENMRTDKDRNREISTAVGIVMVQAGLSHERAFDKLRQLAREQQKPLRDLAKEIVNGLSQNNSMLEKIRKD